MQFQLNEIPSILTFGLNSVLAIIALINRHGQRINIFFALFTLNLAANSLANVITAHSASPEQFALLVRFPYLTNGSIFATSLLYVISFTEFYNFMDKKLLGIPARLYIYGSLAYALLIIISLQIPGFLVEREVTGSLCNFEQKYTFWMIPAMSIGMAIEFLMFVMMFSALKLNRDPVRRRFLLLNTIAMFIILLAGPIFGVIIPLLGFETRICVEPTILLATITLYLTINKYNADQLRELNLGLEQKVEDRTRHLREAQLQLVQSEKMAALGRLAAGVAHEVNTPVGAILSSADTIDQATKLLQASVLSDWQSDTPESHQFKRAFSTIGESLRLTRNAGKRISNMTSSLKRFTHLDAAEFQDIDANANLDATLEILQPEMGDRIEIRKDYRADRTIQGHPAELNYVFLQLISNAMEAIEGGGKIEIQTSNDDKSLIVEVRDTGKGISMEMLETIFDVGFNRSGRRVRMGMGLATSYAIIQQHGGSIEVQSKVNSGSTFRVSLPLAARS